MLVLILVLVLVLVLRPERVERPPTRLQRRVADAERAVGAVAVHAVVTVSVLFRHRAVLGVERKVPGAARRVAQPVGRQLLGRGPEVVVLGLGVQRVVVGGGVVEAIVRQVGGRVPVAICREVGGGGVVVVFLGERRQGRRFSSSSVGPSERAVAAAALRLGRVEGARICNSRNKHGLLQA